MNLSSKTQNGLRILLHVALEARCGRLAQGKDIALKQHINEPYIEQIMISLKTSGLVRTVRGRNGGYTLARPPESISLLDIIQVCEGSVDFSLRDHNKRRSEFTEGDSVINDVLNELADRFCQMARGLSLASILAKYEPKFPEYVI